MALEKSVPFPDLKTPWWWISMNFKLISTDIAYHKYDKGVTTISHQFTMDLVSIALLKIEV